MTEHHVGQIADVPPGESTTVEADGLDLCLFNVDGEFYALPNRCPHQQGPLCEGQIKSRGTAVADESSAFRPELRMRGEVVSCPWHQLEFHVPTGECLAFSDMDLPSYEITARDGDLFVEL